MPKIPQNYSDSSDLVKSKLLQFSEKGATVANRNKAHVRNFALIGLLSAVWISFYCRQQFALSGITTTTILVLLLAPGFTLGRTYFALCEIGELPSRIDQYLGTVKNSVTDYKERVHSNLSSGTSKFRLFDVVGMAKDLRQVVSIVKDGVDLSSLFGGALLLSNPMFLVFLLLASGISALIFLAALITFIAYVI